MSLYTLNPLNDIAKYSYVTGAKTLPLIDICQKNNIKAFEELEPLAEKYLAETEGSGFKSIKQLTAYLTKYQSMFLIEAARVNKRPYIKRTLFSEFDIDSYLRKTVFKDTVVGYFQELKAHQMMQELFPTLRVHVQEVLDTDYAVDYTMMFGHKMILGVQVKPESYKRMEESEEPLEDVKINRVKNQRFREDFTTEVKNLYYNKKTSEFINLNEIVGYITPIMKRLQQLEISS